MGAPPPPVNAAAPARSCAVVPSERQSLLAQSRFDLDRRVLNRQPFPGQRVPDLRFGGPTFALADIVEAMGQQARGPTVVGPSRSAAALPPGRRHRAPPAHPRQMLRAFPADEVEVGGEVPVGRQFVAAGQSRRSAPRREGIREGLDSDVVSPRHGVAGIAFRHAERLEPVDAEAGFRVVAAGPLTRNLVVGPVDKRDAVRTIIGVSSGSSTRAQAAKTPMPGPSAACAMSTGPVPPTGCCEAPPAVRPAAAPRILTV